jgi:uroporphyrin-III C-methyltransferase / precorrin-2 dehydrogenase / sirohydrochlorin ferrochelatase
MQLFPLMLVSKGRKCLVIGTGDIADAKARLARDTGFEVTKCGTLQTSETECLENYSIAFIINDNLEKYKDWARALRRCGVLVNVADQPEMCDFILPAIVDRAPAVVAITTGGASATMARQLRGKIESLLPATLGEMIRFIENMRPQVSVIITEKEDRRRFWDEMTADGGPCDPFIFSSPPEASLVLDQAQRFTGQVVHQRITLICIRSNDPADLTLRGFRRLQQADAVVCIGDRETLAKFAAYARRDATLKYKKTSINLEKITIKCNYCTILYMSGSQLQADFPPDVIVERLETGQAQL